MRLQVLHQGFNVYIKRINCFVLYSYMKFNFQIDRVAIASYKSLCKE